MSWLFSQALVEEFCQGTCSDGEQCAQLSVMPTQHKFWRNDKTMEFSDLSRFGLTCAVLTESRGEELLTLFQAGFPVKTLAQREKERGLMGPDQACGVKWQELSAKYDLDSRSWRTHLCLWDEALRWSSVILPKWGMTVSGVLFQHPTAERPISAKDSGLWPTQDTKGFANEESLRASRKKKEAHWPTPTAHNAKEQDSPAESDRNTITLCAQARGGDQTLPRYLNPEWVEWLMGWPLGWTDLKPLGMGRFQEWQQQHSEYCQE